MSLAHPSHPAYTGVRSLAYSIVFLPYEHRGKDHGVNREAWKKTFIKLSTRIRHRHKLQSHKTCRPDSNVLAPFGRSHLTTGWRSASLTKVE